MIKKFSACLSAIIFLYTGAFADNNAGTTVFNFLKLPATASQAALAGMVSYESASAPMNPSMIAFQDKPLLSASYAMHFQNTSFNSANFTIPAGRWGFNVSYGGMNYGDIEGAEETPTGYIKTGTFSADDAYAGFSVGTELAEDITVGAGVKYVWQTIDGSKIDGIAFSFAGTYVSNYNWYISGGVENAGPDVEGYALPSSGFISFIDTYKDDTIPGEFTFGAEARAFFDQTYWLKASCEYNFKSMFFARAGYSLPLTNSNDSLGDWYEKNLSLGFGFSYDFFKIDYAWLPFGDLGATSMLSLQLTF